MGCVSSVSSSMGPSVPGVTKYRGYKEHAYRLVFPYEDKFKDKQPTLLTILPKGVIETTKLLTPETDRALMAYTVCQAVSEDVAEKVVEQPASVWNGKKYIDTPFVKHAANKYCLAQTWPTKYNEKFRNEFTITDNNPDLKKFESAAVVDFKECVETLFGKDATKTVSIKYCYKQTKNEFPCYLGMTEDLLTYFQDNNQAMQEVGIKEMKSDGFVASGEDGKGNKVEKQFTMDPKTEYVMYKKTGWETMGCCKIKSQFIQDSEFLDKGQWLSCQ